MSISFFRSIRTVLLGMMVAQAIPLIGSLLIARLYAPAEFGLFSTWLGIVVTIAVMLTGRLEMALGVVDDGDSRQFAVFSILVTTFLAASVVGLLAGLSYVFVPFTQQFGIGLVILLAPMALLLAVMQTLQSWAAVDGRYRQLSIMRISQALVITFVQIAIAWWAPSAINLALGQLVGVLAGVCVAEYLMPLDVYDNTHNFFKRIQVFWRSHRKFPMFALPADFINTGAGQLPLLFITSKYGAEASGFFALTLRMLGGPISLLGAAVLDVFKRNAAENFRLNGHCRQDFVRTFKILSCLGVLLAMGVILFAEPAFVYAFGETWREAGVIAIWLMPMFAMRFVASPLSYVFYIAGKQHVDLMWQIALLAMTLVVFTWPDSFEGSVKGYALGYACMYAVYLMLSYRYSKGKVA